MSSQKVTDIPKKNSTNNEPVKETAEQLKQKAGEVAEVAQEQAADISQQAKYEAKSFLETRKAKGSQELHGVARALRQTSDQLRQQDQTMFAEYSNQVADQVERVSSFLQERDLEDLVYEAETFARKQPELFLGGAFTLGLLAARFLKSSAPDNNHIYNQERRQRSFPQTHTPHTHTPPSVYNRHTAYTTSPMPPSILDESQ